MRPDSKSVTTDCGKALEPTSTTFALITQPAMVLSAFSSELYLKCLLCLESGSVPPTHNLKVLFRQLHTATRERLRELWDLSSQTPERQKLVAFIKTMLDSKNLRFDLAYALDAGANAFQELRYFYEKEKLLFLLNDFHDMLRTVILREKGPCGDSQRTFKDWLMESGRFHHRERQKVAMTSPQPHARHGVLSLDHGARCNY